MAETTTGKNHKITWYGDELLSAIEKGLNEAVFETGMMLVGTAEAKAPYDRGTLRESGYVSTTTKSTYEKRRGHRNEVRPRDNGVAVAAFSAPHAHLLEYGTAKMSAQPFFRPALDETKGEMAEKIAVALRDDIRRGMPQG